MTNPFPIVRRYLAAAPPSLALAFFAGLVIALAGCEFFVATVAPTPTLVTSASSSSRPLVAVERGTVEQAIRATGRIVAREREDLYFLSGGRIKGVTVRQGDLVEPGDVLAELETGNLASQVAAAQESFETASLRVKAAQQGLNDDRSNIQQQLLAARNDVIRKQEAIDFALDGGDPDAVATARAQVTAAQLAVTESHINLSVLQRSPEGIRERVELELRSRRDFLADLQRELANLVSAGVPTELEVNDRARTRLENLRSQVANAQANLQIAKDNLDRAINGASGDDLEQAQLIFRRAEINYENALERNFTGDQREQTQISYDLARLAYERAVNPGDETDVAKARVAVQQAEANLERARDLLSDVPGNGSDAIALAYLVDQVQSEHRSEIAAAQLAVLGAQRAVDEYEVELENVNGGRGSSEQRAAQSGLIRVQNTLQQAQIRLSDLLNPSDSAISIAMNDLSLAIARLENLERREEQFVQGDSRKDIDLTIASNNFEQARIQLERLQAQTIENLIIAPFAGEVTFVKGRAGDQIQAYQEIVGLSNPQLLVLESLVPEVEFEDLSIGQIVDVQLDAFPGRDFQGRVTSLPRSIVSNTGQAITVPETEIEVDWGTAGVELGMLARLKITVQVKNDVLKVPLGAVRSVNARDFVETIVDGQRRSLQITTGISSDTEIEIESGLEEGQEIYASP